ncbi:TonB-dependent receptor [Undibacterium sp. SXout11W]|uniref:TonB-dependent receptor n=1 Tax=Undibacterium sp. SXout11W TaxID=3413050 RepID=UPI003BF23864
MNLKKVSLLATSIALLFPVLAHACASCGCTLSPDWDGTNTTGQPGFKLDVRYDYLNQNQLRSGTSTINPAVASQFVNSTGPQEVEKFTKNNYVTVGLDYSNGGNWEVKLQVPYINRNHSTLGTASDGTTAGAGGGQYDSQTSGIGDVKIMARYIGLSESHKFGVLFGAKLATGSHTLTGTSTDTTNPGSAPIDRGLQPGTGTTDLILGVSYADSLNTDWSYFTQAIVQTALNSSDQYKPGTGLNINGGLRYNGFEKFKPMVQFNAKYVQHDTGDNADTISTGGTLAYISPGVLAVASDTVSVYAFVQAPIYQNVRGVQLAPRYTASVGVKVAF